MVDESRAGDADRERVARVVREHWAEGRLDLAELDRRIGSVYAARTRPELDALVADLPGSSARGRAADARLWWPGVSAFHVERHLPTPPAAVYEDALRVIVPRMSMAGLFLESEVAPRRLEFRGDRGLRVDVLLHLGSDGGTVLAAFGHAPRRVRKAFATLDG